jgi:hypothetical protein
VTGGRRDATGSGERGVEDGRSVGDTVGRSGDLGLVWHGGDDSQRLGRLSVGLDLTAGVGVDAGEVLVFTLASLEAPFLGVAGGIVFASDTIVDMFAEVSGVGTSRVASLETELATTHEVMPLNDLLVSVVVARPGGGVEETTEGIATKVGTVRVKLSSEVICRYIDEGLVNETDDLDIVGGPRELNTFESTSGDETTAMTRLGTPGNFLMFRIADGFDLWRCPEAEVIDRVDDASLAEGLLALRRRVTPVVTGLCTANAVVRVSLVWKVIVVEMLGSQGSDGRGGGVLSIHPERDDGDGREG